MYFCGTVYYPCQLNILKKICQKLLINYFEYSIQMKAAPVNQQMDGPIEFSADFEPEVIGCDRYEQYVLVCSKMHN